MPDFLGPYKGHIKARKSLGTGSVQQPGKLAQEGLLTSPDIMKLGETLGQLAKLHSHSSLLPLPFRYLS